MKTKSLMLLLGVLFMIAASPAAWGALTGVGNPINPHGFPAYYQDSNNLRLELCLPPPAGNAALRSGLCTFDPLEGGTLQVGGESFWWMATADAAPLVPGGRARLTLALEAAFTEEVPVDGQQMSFVRLRIRVDVPTPGTYTVTHPFGIRTFENVTVADGINFVEDIGSINITNPALGFQGALSSTNIGPFLTWPNYLLEPGLKALDADGITVLEQYIGDPAIPHVVTGSPTGTNYFRVQGPGGLNTETDLFSLMGKVHDPNAPQEVHLFPSAPPANLFAVGPSNRVGAVGPITPQQPEGIRTGVDNPALPVGFPLWYQENIGTAQAPAGGIKLAYCPATDPMCISEPVNPADPNSVALRVGAEGFWWSAEAAIAGSPQLTGGDARGDALLVLAVEQFFDNDIIADLNQIGFARLRIRVDTPVAGTYTITHPYGTEVFNNVPAGRRGINFSRDVMIIDKTSADTVDSAFVGALYGPIGPGFLKWTTFNINPDLTDPALVKPLNPVDPVSPRIMYVGDPATPHAVTGSPTGNNLFRIRGPNGIDVSTTLFTVTGRLFDLATAAPPPAGSPIAVNDTASLNLGAASSVTINVLANDIITPPATVASITVLPASPTVGPNNGAVAVNANNTITYTPTVGTFGPDTFSYRITDSNGLTSGNAIVTVTVTAVESITVTQARLVLRNLRLTVQGTSNSPGSTLTIHEGATVTGPVIGQAVVDAGGAWRFRGNVTSNITRISIVNNATGATLLNQAVQAR